MNDQGFEVPSAFSVGLSDDAFDSCYDQNPTDSHDEPLEFDAEG